MHFSSTEKDDDFLVEFFTLTDFDDISIYYKNIAHKCVSTFVLLIYLNIFKNGIDVYPPCSKT
jgi:hypothetical protein